MTVKGLADARAIRKADSQRTNPEFTFAPREVLVNLAEAAIILEALGESPLAKTVQGLLQDVLRAGEAALRAGLASQQDGITTDVHLLGHGPHLCREQRDGARGQRAELRLIAKTGIFYASPLFLVLP